MIAATRDWQRHGGFPPLFDADETLALVAEIADAILALFGGE